jgi:hypothetical protein
MDVSVALTGPDSEWFDQAGVIAGGFEALSFDTVF